MPYFECDECGQLADVADLERSYRHQYCPVCDEQTTWRVAFESGGGVSF